MKNKEALSLLNRFSKDECTPEELRLLEYWAHHLSEASDSGLTEEDLDTARIDMWAQIVKQKPAKVRHLQWMRVAAAVLVMAMLSVGIAILSKRDGALPQNERLANHIEAGANKAYLTLSDGRTVILDATAGKTAIADEGVKITHTTDGQLVYTVNNSRKEDVSAYNTLTTPKGGNYQLNLADGTKVWLNAASTIRFPISFAKNKREVQLTGEGYFEVKHLAKYKGETVPFSVKTPGDNGQVVEVLGTHFNINAYPDETVVKTTLLEGSVRLRQIKNNDIATDFQMLKPGEQSIRSRSGISVVEADMEEVIAWKNGYFRFNDESLESIMRKVEKWYNVETVYENEGLRKKSFAGITQRYANVAELLKMLELTDEVKFRIDGKRIVVSEKK